MMRAVCRSVWLASVAAICFAPTGVLSEPVVVIDRKQVNIRTDATTQSQRLTVLEGGGEVEEIRQHNRWLLGGERLLLVREPLVHCGQHLSQLRA